MKQVTKFYFSSFLKNQTYFVPILIVFLQAQSLTMNQIFLVFTIASVFSFLLEIPTGIFADIYGKKKSIIISKALIFLSFVTFGFSNNFLMFVIAQSLFEIGNSFRTGTEAAYIFDYLKLNKKNPTYTEVKGKQKFWARLGESIATAAGGIIAAKLGFNWVFFIAAIPALLNLLNVISWKKICKTTKKTTKKYSEALIHTKKSLKDIITKKQLLKLIINMTIFSAILAALNKFIQPYMTDANIPIEYFGFVYSGALLLTAFLVRYSYVLENKIGTIKTINYLTIFATIPVIIIGTKYISILGVVLFFIVVLIENIRSPIANNLFNQMIESKRRSTIGSILSQSKSLGKIILLPIIGFVTQTFSMYTSMIILGSMILITGLIFYIKPINNKSLNTAKTK